MKSLLHFVIIMTAVAIVPKRILAADAVTAACPGALTGENAAVERLIQYHRRLFSPSSVPGHLRSQQLYWDAKVAQVETIYPDVKIALAQRFTNEPVETLTEQRALVERLETQADEISLDPCKRSAAMRSALEAATEK